MLAILRRLRTHLINNWEVAEEWARHSVASNGALCFYSKNADDGNRFRAYLGEPIVPGFNNKTALLMVLELGILEKGGKL